MLEVKISITGVNEMVGRIPEVRDFLCEDFIERAGFSILSYVKRLAPVDTGRLRSDIRVDNHLEGVNSTTDVYTQVDYAPYVEYGTPPHFPPVIPLSLWARRKGISSKLAGKKKTSAADDLSAGFMIARSIAQKGTKPHPFFGPAIDLFKPEIGQRLIDSFERAKDRFNSL